MLADEKVALNNCEREPVHIPGRIQSFAAVIGFDVADSTVRYFSDNIASIFPGLGLPGIGSDFEAFISDRRIVHAIRGSLGLPSIQTTRDRSGIFELAGKATEFSVYVVDGIAVVEMEPVDSASSDSSSSVATVRKMLSVLETGAGLDELLNSAVKSLRHATGFDRVMAYRFLEEGEGEVVAEAKAPGIEAFLGLRYPAFDIPMQVRQIMLRAPFRFIGDIHDPHSLLIKDDSTPRLDLTLSHLRGVSPIHVEYLENMGVRSTMNVSIIVRGKLWGLFAFHHYRKRTLGPDRRSVCELFGQLASMQIYQALEQQAFQRRNRTSSIMSSLKTNGNSLEEIFPQLAMEFAQILRADGVALMGPSKVSCYGDTPDESTVRAVGALSTEPMFYLDCLETTTAAKAGSLGKTAGVLVSHLVEDQSVLFFRNEVIHEVRWAGQPEKFISPGPNGPRLTPRGSFAEYKESKAGTSHRWKEGDVTAANEICRELIRMAYPASKAIKRDLEKQNRYQDLLIAELNHRVRNTLALTQSIVRQTQASEPSLPKYVNALEQRISSLSKAHDLIGSSGLQWARIEDILKTELKPYDFPQVTIVTRGPQIAIRADVAPIVSLLIHELTSNAAKHGALSAKGDSLEVSWSFDAGGVKICWKEVLKSKIEKPTNRGFGLALIERAIPYECNGKSSVLFEGNELKIEFWLPGESVQHLKHSDVTEPIASPDVRPANRNDQLGLDTVLVVEDNMVLAMEMERILTDLGVAETDSHSSPEAAIEAVERIDFDAGVLDINLGGADSFELAKVMRAKKIPFVFVSGYDSKYDLPPELQSVARLTKPVVKADLILALEIAKREFE